MSRARLDTKVVAYKLNGELYKIFDNAKEAAISLHAFPRSIDKCIRGECKSVFGYMWRRFESDQIPSKIEAYEKPISKNKYSRNIVGSKKIIQYSLDGTYIKQYPSINDAARALGKPAQAISDCANKKYKTAYGYKWRFR